MFIETKYNVGDIFSLSVSTRDYVGSDMLWYSAGDEFQIMGISAQVERYKDAAIQYHFCRAHDEPHRLLTQREDRIPECMVKIGHEVLREYNIRS